MSAKSKNALSGWESWLLIGFGLIFLYEFLKQLNTAAASGQSVVSSVGNALEAAVADVGSILAAPFNALSGAESSITGAASGVSGVASSIGSGLSGVSNFFSAIWQFIVSIFDDVLGGSVVGAATTALGPLGGLAAGSLIGSTGGVVVPSPTQAQGTNSSIYNNTGLPSSANLQTGTYDSLWGGVPSLTSNLAPLDSSGSGNYLSSPGSGL